MRAAVRAPGFSSRRPVRLRLALVYSGLFLAAGTVLLTVTYGLVAESLSASANQSRNVVEPMPGPPPAFANSKLFKACSTGKATANEKRQCNQSLDQAYANGAQAGAQRARSHALDHLLSFSAATLALLAVLSAVLGWIVAGRALRPVHAITAAARRASQENLSERIALAGPPDELKDLADTFDAMLARLEAAFSSQRRFVANASHELRTPLTVMRTAIDVTLAKASRTPDQLEEMASDVRAAAERAEALIEALLTLARSDRGQGQRSALDLGVFAEDALDALAPAIADKSLQVDLALEPAPATGDPVLAERLVTNLLDNAARHNVADGWIQVRTGIRDDMAFISVANSGAVITDSEVSSLFEPFRRLRPEEDVNGFGLGLSIVQSVVAAHGGRVTARPDPLGGLEVIAALPADRRDL
jgi:signal transduction histidine kinase